MYPIKSVYKTLSLILLVFLLGACATLKEDKSYTKKGLTVSFQRLIGIEDEIEEYQIDHPIRISTPLVKNHLLHLWYRPGDKKSKTRPIFSKEEVETLSPFFKSALNKVEIGEYLQFKYDSPQGWVDGEVFASPGKIHWRFSRIHGVYFSKAFFGKNDPSWRLVRRIRSQTIQREKTSFGAMTRENWIINNFNLPAPKRQPLK